MRPLWLSALVLVAAACGSGNPTAAHNPSHAIACAKGSLALNAPLAGHLDSAATCKRPDILTSDSTLTASYSVSVQAGHGYLIAMGGTHLHPVLELTSRGGDTLRAASPTYIGPPPIARMLIASQGTETDTVRVTTFDTLASDTGAFVMSAQTCTVPVAPLTQTADSVTHADSVNGGDCQVDLSDFLDELHVGQVNVHLYALHFQSGNYRRITIDASSPSTRPRHTRSRISGEGRVAILWWWRRQRRRPIR